MPPCELHGTMKDDFDRLRTDIADIYGKVHAADAQIVALTMRVDQRETEMERLVEHSTIEGGGNHA